MRVLPENVILREEDKDTFVVAAEDFIPAHSLIGLAVVKDRHAPVLRGTIYTPLGAYLLDSIAPNCMLLTESNYWTLWSTQDIFINHALSIDTRLYEL